ncbi:hypothetical protein GZH53_04655 [Flavihumibacter sp. R14]|nr:hypothetical protein [Flavihumibacter soli]
MQQLEKFLQQYPGRAFFILLFIAVPPFLINLGLLPLFADEPTRANVALEMILSKNFAVPTIGGEYYYNKPPLYNWMLAGFYLVTGSFSEFVTRLPAAIPMFLFAVTIYYSVNYFLKNKQIAALSGLFFLVNGRMLIYDSMLGHIDIFYSWLTYISFMGIFFFYRRKQWLNLFMFSYLLTAASFLAKGLPSLVFQGFTILALLAYTKNLKKLFSWQHIVSGLACLLVIGAYFFNYYQHNPNLEGYFSTIWDQSSRRTPAKTGMTKTLLHIIQFPFEHLFHLFPVSILVLFCLHKRFWRGLMENDFLKFISITFLANIWVYWISSETRPRYLLMLYPLLFVIWAHAYYTYRPSFPKLDRVLKWVMFGMAGIVTMGLPVLFFFGLEAYVGYLPLKAAVVIAGAAFFTWQIYRFRREYILPFVGFLLIVRLAFSWFVLPHRLHNGDAAYFRQAAIEMGHISRGQPLYFYQYQPDVLSIPFHDRLIFYMERTRMEKVKFVATDAMPGYYFTFDRDIKNPSAELIKSYEANLKLFKVK